jgi:hypothetical protein
MTPQSPLGSPSSFCYSEPAERPGGVPRATMEDAT